VPPAAELTSRKARPAFAGPGRTARASARAARSTRGLAGFAAIGLAAEAVSRSGLVSQAVLPPASTVLARAAGLAGNSRFLTDFAATLQAWAVGLGLTVAVAVPAGLVLGSLPVIRSATRAVVEFLRPIPPVALIPLAALLIGPGLRMNATLIVYAASWPVLFNTIHGLDDVDPLAKETLRAFGFGPLAVLLRVSLPSAAPFIATGIRLASSVAIVLDIGTGVVTGRIDGSGIGAFIADANAGSANNALVLAAALWAGLLGLTLNFLLTLAQRRALPWSGGSGDAPA
jgi:NitT/TauT family transport system permease protein